MTLSQNKTSRVNGNSQNNKTCGCDLHAQFHPLPFKKVARKCDANVASCAPEKLARIFPGVNDEQNGDRCAKRHATQFLGCKQGVLYKVPLFCRKCYIVQTVRGPFSWRLLPLPACSRLCCTYGEDTEFLLF